MARDMRRQLAPAQGFATNAPISFELPVTAVYKEIVLSLEYAASTNGTGTLVTPFDRAPWTLVKRIELIADGRDVIKTYDGGTLLDINQWDFGEYPPSQVTDLAVTSTNGTAAEPLWHSLVMSLESRGMVPEMGPDGKVVGGPQMTFLDARKLQSLELKVTFGQFGTTGSNDIFTTSAATATLDRFHITPWGHEILDLSKDSSFALNQEVMNSFSFPTNTAAEFQRKLNVGNAYRRIFISTVDQNARAAVERIEKMTLTENGAFNRRIWDAGVLKSQMALKHGLALGLDPANPATLVRAIPRMIPAVGTTGKQGGNRAGLFVIDIAEDGKVGSLLDTRGFSDLSLFLAWDGANTTDLIRVTTNQILPNVR
jgi:hypothetical protein